MRREIVRKTSTRNLSVEKIVEEPDSSPVLVTLSVESTADVPVALRLVDELPESASPTDVTFHRDVSLDYWDVYETGKIAYSDTISPEATLDAWYYLDTGITDSTQFVAPTVDATTPVRVETATASDPPTWRGTPTTVDVTSNGIDGPLPTAVQSGCSGGASADGTDAKTGSPEDGEAAAGDKTVAFGDHADGTASDPSAVFAELQVEYEQEEYAEFEDELEQQFTDDIEFEELIDGDEEEPVASEASDTTLAREGRSVLDELVEELEERELSEDEQELVREQLGLTVPHHTTVRVQRLQSEVADLAAYTDALESFLDENGGGKELIETLETDLERVQTRLDDLEASTATIDNRQTSLERRLDTVETTLDGVNQRLDAAVQSLTDTIDRHCEEISSLRGAVESAQENYERIASAFRSTTGESSDRSES